MTPYFERNGIALYHGDARIILPTLAAGSVASVITDPPFEAEAHTLQRRINRSKTRGQPTSKIVEAPLPFAALDEHTRQAVALEFGRLAERWVLVFCQIEAAMTWKAALEDGRLTYRRTCLWIKPDGMPQYSGDRPGMGYESIVAMHRRGKSRWNGGGSHGVFSYPKSDGLSAREAPHPTTKPQRLMRRLVSLFSDPGELVLDPFAGSGSTLIAAHTLGRRAIGVELDEKYCEIAARRLEGAMAQGDLFLRRAAP